MQKTRFGLLLTVLILIALISGGAYATSYHATRGGSIILYQANGVTPATSSIAYSPKASCARVCHAAETGRTDDFQHTYGTGTVDVPKNQKVITSGGALYDENFTVSSYAHGVSVGRHMNQGRNESYTAAQRTTYGDPFFTNSPGMAGKY